MIASLKGKVFVISGETLILDVNGVGYRLKMPTPFLAKARQGQELSCFTHLAVRENEWVLFGFQNLAELELFELLLTVQGVGPKVALAALSAMSPESLANAIANEQADLLTRLPGVGKKTAQRLVLDLKQRVGHYISESDSVVSASHADAITALTALGYSVAEAQNALRSVDVTLPVEDKIFAALQRLSA